MSHPITPDTNSDGLELDELDLILAELQGNMVNVPATMKAKQAIERLIIEELINTICHKHGWNTSCPKIKSRIKELTNNMGGEE